MSRAARVRFLHTRFPHHGAHAGANQLARYLDPTSFRAQVRAVSDSDADFPIANPWLRQRLKARGQRSGMKWYKLSDLAAEISTLRDCLVGRVDVVHCLDGEHSCQFLPGWLRTARFNRTAVGATFHQPPDLLDGLVDPKVVSCLDFVTVVSPSQEPWFRTRAKR